MPPSGDRKRHGGRLADGHRGVLGLRREPEPPHELLDRVMERVGEIHVAAPVHRDAASYSKPGGVKDGHGVR